VKRTVASLAVSAFVASCSLALFLSWDVLSEPRPARAQTTGTCPNAQFIDTFTGNGDQQTDTFNTTTNSFRVSYNVTGADPQFPASLFVDVIDANDPFSCRSGTLRKTEMDRAKPLSIRLLVPTFWTSVSTAATTR
jgi:hypothetical protein